MTVIANAGRQRSEMGYTMRNVQRFNSGILFFAAAASVILGSAVLTANATATKPTPTSCVHEMRYEPFAGLIIVSMTIDDSPPLDFVLDSGATHSFLTDPLLAVGLGLEVTELGLARGVGLGTAPVLMVEKASIRNDGVEVLHAPLVVHDIGTRLEETAGREIHGFLGADIFENFVVEINPAGHRLLLHDPETFDADRAGLHVPLEIIDRRPIVRCSTVVKENGKEVPVRLMVDTGSNRALSFITKSARHLKPPSDRTDGESVGVVGETDVVVARTRKLSLGPIIARDIKTTWLRPIGMPAVRNIRELNGILGNRFLRQFRVFFDYRGNRMIFENVPTP